ncbi:MAG: vWA domain-containing protein [Nannocystales bacterium]
MQSRVLIGLGCLGLTACSPEPSGQGFDGAASGGVDTVPDPGSTTGTDSEGEGDETAVKLDVMGVDPDTPPGKECADVTAEITPGDATIMLLLDQSGSMSDALGGSGVDRWNAVFTALLDADDGVVADFESDLHFGMSLYTDGDAVAGCPDLTTIEPSLENRAAMASEYTSAMPIDDTPTGESLLEVGALLAGIEGGGAKAVIVATDGDPDTCACPDACAGASKGVAVDAAQQLFDMDIKVFVIAVGDSITDLEHLQHLANVGGGRARYDDDPAFDEWTDDWVDDPAPADPATLFTANDPAALADAFNSLVAGFVPCEFEINGEILDVAEACAAGDVELDGVDLTCPDDWELVDESTLRLLGENCDALQDGQPHDVEASFPCEVIVVG